MPKRALPPMKAASAEHARAVRAHGPDSAEARDAKARLAAAVLAEKVQRALDDAPELSPTDAAEVAGLLRASARKIVTQHTPTNTAAAS